MDFYFCVDIQNALPFGKAFDLSQPYCQGLLQHLTALFIMITYSGEKSKKTMNLHNFCIKRY